MDQNPQRQDKPWPAFLDFIFSANMTAGTIRMVATIAVFVAVFGTLFWLLD
ncbi:MAG: hypothetical protein V7704_07780 [Aurantimonas endophytica]|uniref:Uncharacterized protein n=1 Tax=Aurantimonas endophytica TaxID=1522175 RepID=A0A7W6HFG1_9HYPH|nr:hypothetical protein [Aurantimonas endophytica]MBB4004117.1 hypothetical protein [Aurantimonas endophytica]MCO6404961.1 hypothetical protein [Aurantimonas endophytica]